MISNQTSTLWKSLPLRLSCFRKGAALYLVARLYVNSEPIFLIPYAEVVDADRVTGQNQVAANFMCGACRLQWKFHC